MIDYQKEFLKCLNSIDPTKRRYDVFKDFLTATTLAFQNSTRFIKDKKIEDDYQELIVNRYKPEQIKKLAELLYITVQALTYKSQDFLGNMYMFGDFGNKHTGQFFTPYHIADFMAQITIYESDLEKYIDEKGYMTICDPCCGSGVFMIAASQVIMNIGYNPQKVMWFQGTDIDINCCKKAYIQTSLLGLSGEIIYGNTLTLESWKRFITPMTLFNSRVLKEIYYKEQKPKEDNVIDMQTYEAEKKIKNFKGITFEQLSLFS